jgi:hypothetical protein
MPVNLYHAKTQLLDYAPFEACAFIDSDTVIVGPLDDLWPRAADEIVLTARSNGISAKVKMRLRMKWWLDAAPQLAARMAKRVTPWPPINTGIMAFGPEVDSFVRRWQEIALLKPELHSVDEMAAQLICPDFPVRFLGPEFNGNISEDFAKQVRIWHGPRGQFWRNARGAQFWRPFFARALDHDFGNIRQLLPLSRWMLKFFRGMF